MDRWKRLAATLVVAMCGAFSVGHYAGSSGAASDLADCRAAVVASLDEWQGVEGASIRYEKYVSRCL